MALVDRVKNILLSPHTEWLAIDAEPATVSSLYTGYIAPLAAIPAVCKAIGMSLIGTSVAFIGNYKTPFGSALASAVVMYVFSLATVYLIALIVDNLAPTFAGTKNMTQALKVVAYSFTAAWVGGVFSLIPVLGIITLLFVLYSLYLLFLGLPVLMKAPGDKSVGYTVVVVICTILVSWVILWVVGMLGLGYGAGAMATGTTR